MTTTTMGRMTSLGRAELTLLLRSKASLFTAVFAPVLFTVAMRSSVEKLDLGGTGLSVGTVLVPASIGFVLIFAVYSNLTGVYVARREELVLKRLRTGEASDGEILAANALPSVTIALVQALLMIAGGVLVLNLEAPRRPDLVLVGLVLGLVMMTALAALSANITRTSEAAQLTPLPLMLVSMAGSGMFVPLDVMPDQIANICRLLPMSPLIELLRGGWTGGMDTTEVLRALLVALVWTVGSVFAVTRWFRWDPRK